MSLLAARGLAVLRGGRLLIEELNLELGPGEAVQVTGPNGAGKSSLLRCLAGLLAPANGTIDRPAGVALADERLPLDSELSLASALAFWSRLDPSGGAVDGALGDLGLGGLADVPVRLLSSGQRKRAALALVRMSSARVWLLDEPLNALDADSIARVDRLIAEHRGAGGAVVAATHQPLAGQGWRSVALAP